ncbi:hypothetical protein TUM12151_29230 [Morganella morganii]|nr:hypothetical protein TUM12151_29230 [Morganella morganii]
MHRLHPVIKDTGCGHEKVRPSQLRPASAGSDRLFFFSFLISALTITCETIRDEIISNEIVLDKTMKKGEGFSITDFN